MAQTDESSSGGGAGLDRLKDELTQLGTALAQKLADRLSDKISDVTKDLAGAASEGGKALQPKELAKTAAKGAVPGMGGGNGPGKAVAGKVKEAVPGMGGGGGGDGDGEGEGREPGEKKVTTIIEAIDVGMPLRTVYDHWTQWENFPDFMKGVVSVDQDDEERTSSNWKMKIAWSNRSWQATVEEQIPDERILWTSEGEKATTRGVVTFHEVAPRLTRVVVVVEYTPAGFFEKTANLWRAQGRRLRLDLKHFQRMVTIAPDEEIEGWRGTIRDGQVVTSHEDAVEKEKQQGEEDGEEEPSQRDQGEGEGDEGDDGEEGDEDEGDDGEEDEDEGDGER